MIKLNRGPIPEYLNSPKIEKAKSSLEALYLMHARQERLRFDITLLIPIKKDLLKLCNDKCAYCESKIGVSTHGDIENFRPKGGAKGFNSNEYAPNHYWWLSYEWENLLISCQICNQKYKRDYFPLKDEKFRAKIGAVGVELLFEQALLLDPCLDDPIQHLDFNSNGIVKELTQRGKVTIEILGLNRYELVSSRKQEAVNLKDKLAILQTTKNVNAPVIKPILAYINDLFSDYPTQEYVAIKRKVFDEWYAKNKKIWENAKFKMNIYSSSSTLAPTTPKVVIPSTKNEIDKLEAQLTALKRFSIRRIEIQNFKSIEKLTLNIKPIDDKESRESWLLLLGDNGIGKSSILQAIALCLTPKNSLDKLNLDVSDYLRRGKRKGKVKIYSYEHDRPITLLISKLGFETELNEAPTFILGYGSTRLLPKGNIQPDNDLDTHINIRNLFDYSVALGNPNQWLSKISKTEFNERVAPAFFDILALRGEDKLFLKDGKINVRQFGEDHDLEDNSDGYKTITALVSDIMHTLSIDKANYHNAQGIVLIDEIGNHLHPRWRLKIVGALRKTFPKLQFIVTTHEPLCLRGLSHGEVVVLVRDQNNNIQGLEGELLPDHNLMSLEQLLTSDLFGLINTLDDETEKTYEEYYNLLSKKDEDKTPEDLNTIKELSAKLDNNNMLGNTPREQMYYKIIDETFAQKLRVDGFKTKENLKKETISQVKGLLRDKNIDWI